MTQIEAIQSIPLELIYRSEETQSCRMPELPPAFYQAHQTLQSSPSQGTAEVEGPPIWRGHALFKERLRMPHSAKAYAIVGGTALGMCVVEGGIGALLTLPAGGEGALPGCIAGGKKGLIVGMGLAAGACTPSDPYKDQRACERNQGTLEYEVKRQLEPQIEKNGASLADLRCTSHTAMRDHEDQLSCAFDCSWKEEVVLVVRKNGEIIDVIVLKERGCGQEITTNEKGDISGVGSSSCGKWRDPQ